jgi:hypothetical protein
MTQTKTGGLALALLLAARLAAPQTQGLNDQMASGKL